MCGGNVREGMNGEPKLFNGCEECRNALIAAVRKYTDMQQLDASILREFVEKIHISEVYTPDENEPRIKIREIEIDYNYIGAFDFEEARKQSQAAQKEKKPGVA